MEEQEQEAYELYQEVQKSLTLLTANIRLLDDTQLKDLHSLINTVNIEKFTAKERYEKIIRSY